MISVGMNYYTDNRANEQPGMGRIARYAWGKDYHTVMSQRLAQLEAKIAALAPGVTTKSLYRYRPDHGKGLGAAGWPWLDRETFQSRLGRIWLLAPARGDSDDPGSDSRMNRPQICAEAAPSVSRLVRPAPSSNPMSSMPGSVSRT